jgi:NTP-dependent ternary system trypsin peptidase co-occuring protein
MGEIMIEVLPIHSPGGNLSARTVLPESFTARSAEIADSFAQIGETLTARLDQLRAEDHKWGLAEVTVELGLAVQAESGVVIIKASAGATFKATLTWRSDHIPGTS